jgi:phospholipase C
MKIIVVFFLTMFAPLAHAADAAADHAAASLARIGHVVIIFEENRSFDNAFGLFPHADGLRNARRAPRQADVKGKVYSTLPPILDTSVGKAPIPDARFPTSLPNAPFPIDRYLSASTATGDLVHRFYQEQAQIDHGRMDNFAAISDAGGLTMGYYDLSQSAQWKLAAEFAIGDRMFHSAFGGSFFNHSFLVCSCAFQWPHAPADAVAILDPNGNLMRDGQVTSDFYVVNTSQSVNLHASDIDATHLVPAQTMPHIGDRLDSKGVTWAWYSGGYADALAGHPDPKFQFHHQPLAYFKDLEPGSPGQKSHLKDVDDLYRDIDQNSLPTVVFYKPIGELNLHPGYATITAGDDHLGDLVDRLRKSAAYQDMLIIITYDESGGFWDHVPPPKRDRWGPGTRVPLIAVGPFVKKGGFVDHTIYDFGSILRTLEIRFGVEPLSQADAKANDLRNLLQ